MSSNNLKNNQVYKDGKPFSGEFDIQKGTRYEKFTMVDGKREGEYSLSEKSGPIGYDSHKIKANYKNGKLHGSYYEIDEYNGSETKANYTNGRLDGSHEAIVVDGFTITNSNKDDYDGYTARKELTFDIKNNKSNEHYVLQANYINNDHVQTSSLKLQKDNENVTTMNFYCSSFENVDFNSFDGMMDIYKKVLDSVPHSKEEIAQKKLILKTFDKFIFSTPEAKEILAEYLNQPNQDEINHVLEKNYKMKKASQFNAEKKAKNEYLQKDNKKAQEVDVLSRELDNKSNKSNKNTIQNKIKDFVKNMVR